MSPLPIAAVGLPGSSIRFSGSDMCPRMRGFRTEDPAGGSVNAPRAIQRDRAVFDLQPHGASTIYDVRDAVETCSVCGTRDSRRECFVVFGLDSDRVDKYHAVVETLTKCIELEEVPGLEADARRSSPWSKAAGGLRGLASNIMKTLDRA